eukprot:3084094-Amphidinium_carterae.1
MDPIAASEVPEPLPAENAARPSLPLADAEPAAAPWDDAADDVYEDAPLPEAAPADTAAASSSTAM